MEEHGPQSGLLLAASREVSGPTFKFSSTPARPGRPAAQARLTKEGGGLSWPGLDLFSRSCQRPIFLLSTNSLPASDRNSIFPSLPFLFFYPSPLHSSKNFSIFDQSDIQNVAQRQCQGPGHAREYSQCLQPSSSPKKFPRSKSRGNNIASFATPQRHQPDPRQHCQWLKDDRLDLLEMIVCLDSVVWRCQWLIVSLEKICPPM